MESQEMIRAYLLEKGDIFKITGRKYIAHKIENGKIFYHPVKEENSKSFARHSTMGANSREKLILITNKTKQNEHQN